MKRRSFFKMVAGAVAMAAGVTPEPTFRIYNAYTEPRPCGQLMWSRPSSPDVGIYRDSANTLCFVEGGKCR